MDYEQIQKNNFELQNASGTASKATADFNRIQIDVNETRIKTLEKIAYFSSGTIALSITFVGYLLSNGFLDYLKENFLKIPLLYILFSSWALLLLSVIGSIAVRFWNASYLLYNAAFYWASSNKELKNKMLKFISTGSPVAFVDADTPEQAENNLQEGLSNYTDLETQFGSKKSKYLTLVYWIQKISIGSFLAGLVCLLLFSVLITNGIVFK